MRLEPTQKIDIQEVLKDLDQYRPKRRGWTWRRPVKDQQVGAFVLKHTSANVTNSVPLPAAHAFGNIDPQCDMVLTTEIASGRFEDDLRRMRMAAWHGADHINASHIMAAAGEVEVDLHSAMPIPTNATAQQTAVTLTRWAVDLAVWRHAGEVRVAYGAYGRHELVEGRDLTAIQYVIGTGGALTRLGVGQEILGHIKADPRHRKLLPPRDAQVLLDQHYIMAAAGVLSQHYPEVARALLCESLGCLDQDAHHGRTVRHHRA